MEDAHPRRKSYVEWRCKEGCYETTQPESGKLTVGMSHYVTSGRHNETGVVVVGDDTEMKRNLEREV